MNVKLNTFLRIALILAVFGLPSVAWAQTTAPGDVSAEVQELPISLTQNTPLSFGTLMPFGRPGWVQWNADASSGSSNVHIVTEGTQAGWIVRGVPGAFYDLTQTTSTTLTNGSDTMEVVDMHSHGVLPALNQGGENVFYVGGTLNVNANQPPGLYTGTYEVTAVYN